MLRRTLVLAAALLLAAAPGVASAQTYGGATVAVSDGTVVAGQTIDVSASCFLGNVTFTLQGTDGQVVGDTGSGIADVDGTARARLTVPNLAPGTYTITATGDACDGSGPSTATTNITVVGSTEVGQPGGGTGFVPVRTPGPTRGGTLPRTGAETTFPLLQAGTVLVLVGGGVLFSIRNRRNGSRGATVTNES